MNDFDGRVAVVTGGGGGIGGATARLFAERGASVVVLDIDRDAADRVVAEIEGAGGAALAVAIDVSSEDDVRGMVDTVTARFGPVAVLHNNAAHTDIALDSVPLTDLDMSHWDQAMAVNVRGYALMAKHLVPGMIELGGGAIVNTASGAGLHGDLVRTAYGTSKAAIIGLTRYIATQFGRFGVRCNAIAPGLIATPAVARELDEAMRLMITSHQLTLPLGQPEDIAELVTFLASDRAKFITGETIAIDGGITAHSPMYAETIRMFESARQ
jgi:NAD(P)-dependent dehydrogenase (short-subunit alcohol dehydrogenase family)